MKWFALPLIFLALNVTAAAAKPTPANDNLHFANPCEFTISGWANLELTEADGEIAFGYPHKSEKIHEAMTRLDKLESEGIENAETQSMRRWYSELMNDAPYIRVSGDGTFLGVEKLQWGNGYRVSNHPFDDISTTKYQTATPGVWLQMLGQPSTTGRFFTTNTETFSEVRILSSKTSETVVLLEIKPEDRAFGARVTFTQDDRYATVNRRGLVEIYEMNEDKKATLLETYRLNTDLVAEVHYLPKQRSLLAFYLYEEPLLLKLLGNGNFHRQFFEKAPTTAPGPKADAIVEIEGFEGAAAQLANANYDASGAISNSGLKTIAVRKAVATNFNMNLVDIFANDTQKFLGSIAIRGEVRKVAFSPDENKVAVSGPAGVLVFDLRKSWTKPAVFIHMQLYEAQLLSFPANDTVICGSANFVTARKFKIP